MSEPESCVSIEGEDQLEAISLERALSLIDSHNEPNICDHGYRHEREDNDWFLMRHQKGSFVAQITKFGDHGIEYALHYKVHE